MVEEVGEEEEARAPNWNSPAQPQINILLYALHTRALHIILGPVAALTPHLLLRAATSPTAEQTVTLTQTNKLQTATKQFKS
jgi:hypothetical protein